MIINLLHSQDRNIVVIIDADLIGKKFVEKNRQLDLSADFYKGEEKIEDEIKRIGRSAYILHIVGKESVAFATKQKWIDESSVITIKNVPHAEVILNP